MAKHNEIGKIGESIATKWLESHKYSIIQRNYFKKWGEIDIIASKNSRMHFVEVKSVSYETRKMLECAVSHETWRPEENVHREKLKRLGRAIETLLFERQYTGAWQIDVLTIRIVPRERFARVNLIDNVILD